MNWMDGWMEGLGCCCCCACACAWVEGCMYMDVQHVNPIHLIQHNISA